MPTLDQLLKHRTSAIAEDTEATAALVTLATAHTQASTALTAGQDRKALAAAAITAADQAIHDLLRERGMHSLVDPKDQTIVIYAATDAAPGWFCTHPVPGATA